jgi:hypothetical protein
MLNNSHRFRGLIAFLLEALRYDDMLISGYGRYGDQPYVKKEAS